MLAVCFHKFIAILLSVVAIFFAIVFHEISHAFVAYLLGDDTAKKAGRFNIHTHFDLFGSFVIPLCLFVVKFPFLIGYAKPVPINPKKFKDPIIDMAFVAMAGPLCNLLLAIISSFVLKGLYDYPIFLQQLCFSFMLSNLALLFFNLIPIPPLDGSRLIAAILPKKLLVKYYSIENFGFILLIFFEFSLRSLSKIVGYNLSLFYYFVEIPINGMLAYLL